MRRWFELLALAAGLAALTALCWRFGFSEIAAALRRVSPRYLLVYLAFGATARLGYALRWWYVARTLGAPPPFPRFIAARLAGDATGCLLPTGRLSGDPLRAGLVCGDGVRGSQASAGVAIDRIIETLGNMLSAVAYVAVFSLTRAGGTDRATLILIVTMSMLLAALAIPLEMLRRGRRPLEPLYRLMSRYGSNTRWVAWTGALQRTEEYVMRFFREHRAVFIQGLIGSLVIEGLIIGEYHFLLSTFGVVVTLPTLLMTLLASGLSRVVPTPAGLGALEAGQVTAYAVVAGQPAMGFVVALVLRLHETLWTSVGLMALALQGSGWAWLRGALSTGELTS